MEKRKTIVLVEDDTDSRAALTVILDGLGYHPVAFPGAAEALAEIEKIDVTLFMLDIMMPDMNGLELLQKIRGIEKYKKTPAIMVTAKDEDKEVLEGYQHGADYYITKPYTTKQIEYGLKLYLNPESENT